MNRVFKTRTFSKWVKKTELTDQALCKAVSEMEDGLCDADLGGNVFKKRVALPGRGKSGSTRTLVATNLGYLWFFMFGFEKSEKDNITKKEKEALQLTASDLLKLTPTQINSLIKNGQLKEICNDQENN